MYKCLLIYFLKKEKDAYTKSEAKSKSYKWNGFN